MVICVKRGGIEKFGKVEYHSVREKMKCQEMIFTLYLDFYNKLNTSKDE